MGKIIAYTGPHGTGKTMAVHGRIRELKREFPRASVVALQEVASLCPLPINRETTAEAQRWIFCTQMTQEIELLARGWDFIVADRTCVDAIAYTLVGGFRTLAEEMSAMVLSHLSVYDEIIFRSAATNAHLFEDGIRDCDAGFQAQIESTLLDTYSRLGFGPGTPGFFVA